MGRGNPILQDVVSSSHSLPVCVEVTLTKSPDSERTRVCFTDRAGPLGGQVDEKKQPRASLVIGP